MITFNHSRLADLVQNRISLAELGIGGIQLGKHYSCIDLFEINDIYIIDPAVEGYDYENSNRTIRERFASLENFDGHLHLAGGLTCGIKKQVITDFRFTKKYLEPVAHFTREEILHFHGEPDYELVDDEMYGGFNYAVDSCILVYTGKKLNFHVDPGSFRLTEISTYEPNIAAMSKR